MLTLLCLVALQTPRAVPAPVPAWTALKAAYQMVHAQPQDFANVQSMGEGDDIKTTFTFNGTPGDTVHAVFAEPKNANHVPVVILIHGLGGSKTQMIDAFGPELIAHGVAYAAIDLPGHGERMADADKKALQAIGVAFFASKGDLLQAIMAHDPSKIILPFITRAVHDGVIDNRHLIDFIDSRKEIDPHKVGFIGVSLGSITGSILGPTDGRLNALALLVGGDPALPFVGALPPDKQEGAYTVCCSLYAPHYEGIVRMLSGTKDSIVPKSATERLFDAFPPKERTISWFDSDHFLPKAAYTEAVEWVVGQEK